VENCASTVGLEMLQPKAEEFESISDAESLISQHYTFRRDKVKLIFSFKKDTHYKFCIEAKK
jgi:hypothetical protein